MKAEFSFPSLAPLSAAEDDYQLCPNSTQLVDDDDCISSHNKFGNNASSWRNSTRIRNAM